MKYNLEEVLEIYSNESTITATAKEYCKRNNIEYSDVDRRSISKLIAKVGAEKDKDLDNFTETETNQYDSVSTLSALKPDGKIMTIDEYCVFYNIPRSQVKTYKLITHSSKGAYFNIASHTLDNGLSTNELVEKLIEGIKDISTLPKSIDRVKVDDTSDHHLLVVDPADVHIGKLADSFETGEDYNQQIAVKRVTEGVEGILEKSKGFKIDQILFIGGNDILHIDNPKRTTTSGTNQDTDGAWYENFLTAKKLYVDVLDRLLKVANVHFVFNPSNHDFISGFFLADVIKTYYKDCDNITFDCNLHHRKYYRYHDNLIGSSHGDGAKTADLPLLMAQEAKDWSDTKHRYIYTHHIHHKTSKDYIGVTIESMRSPSGADAWHSRNGYQHAPKAIEGFIHHKTNGQVARLTTIF